MKKTLLTIAIAAMTLAASAQTVSISTYAGSNLSKLDGATRDITMTRTMFKGWNTVSLPFSMTEAQVNEYFGADCRLEKFVALDGNTMIFQDVKADGIQANVPYILYFTGENTSVRLNVPTVTLYDAESAISFTNMDGMTVTMNGTQKALESANRYGILAVDNDEASFVNVSKLGSRFYATRCFVTISNIDNETSTDLVLATRHIAAGETTAIANVKTATADNGTVYGINGQRVSKNQKGIQVVKGKKVAK